MAITYPHRHNLSAKAWVWLVWWSVSGARWGSTTRSPSGQVRLVGCASVALMRVGLLRLRGGRMCVGLRVGLMCMGLMGVRSRERG